MQRLYRLQPLLIKFKMRLLLKHLTRKSRLKNQNYRQWQVKVLSWFGIFLFTLLSVLSLAPPAHSVAFTSRFQTKDKGDIVFVSNTIMTCPTSNTNCTSARAGTAGTSNQNNAFNMVYVDVDSDASTFNSSSANLNLPAGSTVLWAGLYWGGDAASNTARDRVRLATPTSGGYTNITGSIYSGVGYQNAYQGFANVTSLLQTGGNGTYTVANVQSTINSTNHWGGWSLVVVYRNLNEQARNLSVYDGLEVVSGAGSAVNITVSGFTTPPFGAVNVKLGAIVYDGDRGSGTANDTYTGDQFRLNGTNISNATNPNNDVFNSTISSLGNNVTSKNPNYVNQLGYDADIFNANGILTNNSTSATLTVTTGGETIVPGVITSAIDLYTPVFTINKIFTDLNDEPVEIGDILEYTVAVRNNKDANGNGDPANNNILIDPIPANTTYVTNSLKINGAAKTDASGDDQAEFDVANNRTVFRLGAGANASIGGTLQVAPTAGSSSTIQFRVSINPGTPSGVLITNQAEHSYTGVTLGQGVSLASASPAVSVETRTAALSLVKRITAIDNIPLSGFDGISSDPNDNGNTLDDTNWPQPLATYLRGRINGGLVKPTDEVEYTIYFLGNRRPSINASICDLVPDNQTFVTTGYNTAVPRPIESGAAASSDTGIALGFSSASLPTDPTVYLTNANDGDRGRYYPPGDPQTPAICQKFNAAGDPIASGSAANTNGAVVVNIVQGANQLPAATSAGNPPNSYGFIRFKARVR
jgi:uncharacterized repeat protein (TIGR01451 family)